MSVPSFFGSLFGELIPGGDCSIIQQDPHADPFDKEICQQFGRFNSAFGRGFDIEHRSNAEEDDDRDTKSDPQSLRDGILNRSDDIRKETSPRWQGNRRHRRPRIDEDLDESVKGDPRLLDDYLKQDLGTSDKRSPTGQKNSNFHSSYSSVVITTRPDGSYEKRRTVKDSDGNEEVTVTYSDGKQSNTTKDNERQSDISSRLWDWLGRK